MASCCKNGSTSPCNGESKTNIEFKLNFFLRGLDVSRLYHHLDLVFGSREQFDGPALAEPGSVHLEKHRSFIGLDAQGDGDVDDRRNVVHYPVFCA